MFLCRLSENAEVFQPVLQERIQARVGEQIAGFLGPPNAAQIAEVTQPLPLERIQVQGAEQFRKLLVPRIMEEVVDVFKSIPQVQVPQRIRSRSLTRQVRAS